MDLYSLMGGAGTGEFVRAVLDNQLLLELQSLCYPVGPNGSPLIYADGSLPMIMRLYYDTFVLAIRIGLLAVETRGAKGSYLNDDLSSQQQELKELRELLVRLWGHEEVGYLFQNQASFPLRSQNLLQQVSPSPSSLPLLPP